MVHSALTTRFATTTDYSSRNGARVTSTGHHHAASTSLEGTLLQFQPGGREVSPNYCIEGKNIVLVVPEEYRAWCSGDAWADGQSIVYEIINSSGSPDWRFSADTIASVIALDIDICRRYGITPKWGLPGLWQHRNLYEWFQRSYPTACAGPSFPQDQIVSAVSAGLAGLPTPGLNPSREDDIMFLHSVTTGEWVIADALTPPTNIANMSDGGVSSSDLIYAAMRVGYVGFPNDARGNRDWDVARMILRNRANANRGQLVNDIAAKLGASVTVAQIEAALKDDFAGISVTIDDTTRAQLVDAVKAAVADLPDTEPIDTEALAEAFAAKIPTTITLSGGLS